MSLKTLKELSQKRLQLIIALVVIQLSLLILSIPFFNLDGDEAWCAEQAYFMSKKGYSTSNLFTGFDLQNVRIVVQHKLFIYLGAVLFRLFHFGLFVFRLIPICSFVLLLFFFVKYQKEFLPASGKQQWLLSIAILLSIREFFYLAKVARPEMLVTLLGFISYYLLMKYFRKEEYWLVGAAGLFAGLSMLAHLNGSIFIATGMTVLLVRKKVFPCLLFGAMALVAFTPYLVDVYMHYQIFLVQISNPYVINKTHFTLLKPFLNLSREHERLFRKPEIIIPSSLFFFSILANRKRLFADETRSLAVYTLILMVFLGMIVQDKTINYSAYLMPFWAILIARSVLTLKAEHKVVSSTSIALLLILFATGLYWHVNSVFEKQDYPPLSAEIASYIPRHSVCVAPMNFIFNQIGNYKILSDYLVGFEGFGKISIESMSKFCRKNHCQYVIFDKYGDVWDYMSDYDQTARLVKHFKVIVANANFTVLKYIRPPAASLAQAAR